MTEQEKEMKIVYKRMEDLLKIYETANQELKEIADIERGIYPSDEEDYDYLLEDIHRVFKSTTSMFKHFIEIFDSYYFRSYC